MPPKDTGNRFYPWAAIVTPVEITIESKHAREKNRNQIIRLHSKFHAGRQITFFAA